MKHFLPGAVISGVAEYATAPDGTCCVHDDERWANQFLRKEKSVWYVVKNVQTEAVTEGLFASRWVIADPTKDNSVDFLKADFLEVTKAES